jgi:hypothetical protein
MRRRAANPFRTEGFDAGFAGAEKPVQQKLEWRLTEF